ncbi:MAG: hypothetical protein JWR52_820 [Marmoricola sp.]|nr:hypothetical protein [Marmoricola sp.]MCW2855205.1 hypothetical protein [Marmoricola sp.]
MWQNLQNTELANVIITERVRKARQHERVRRVREGWRSLPC